MTTVNGVSRSAVYEDELPGGLIHGHERLRSFSFHPPTGEVEMAVAEAASLVGASAEKFLLINQIYML